MYQNKALDRLTRSMRDLVLSWLDAAIEKEVKTQILQYLQTDPRCLVEGFSHTLAFGTSGFRALMGVGPARMNVVTVRWISQGLAHHVIKNRSNNKKIVIAFDNRKDSALFAKESAKVFAASGIQVVLLQELRPVPFLSFAVRELGCSAGVMITASHNPKEYNGYKIYGADGGEIAPSQEKEIQRELDNIDLLTGSKVASYADPLIQVMDPKNLDQGYFAAMGKIQLFPEEDKKHGSEIEIVYSSLHGTGVTLTPMALSQWGFTHLHLVEEQCKIDPYFSTVENPNPEHKETYALGFAHLRKRGADLLLLNDGDADRIGVGLIDKGKERILNGNEIAILCAYFLCSTRKLQQRLPVRGIFISTNVTTELVRKIAAFFHVEYFEVHTGFKFIAEMIHMLEEKQPDMEFLFGVEESYGCLLGSYARDKDGVASACFFAEMALYCKRKGQTLIDLLTDIYCQFGVFRERQHSLVFPDDHIGVAKREEIMGMLRKNPFLSLGKEKVLYIEDYEKGVREHIGSDKKEKLSLPKANTMLFRFSSGDKIVIRPSGTESKIRLHIEVQVESRDSIEEAIKRGDRNIAMLLQDLTEKLTGERQNNG